MTRRLKRSKEWELTLVIKDDNFIKPPSELQRNAVLNKAIKEFGEDLTALDKVACRFTHGNFETAFIDRTQKELADDDIMEDWQLPIMQAMAERVCESKGHILEIGFGKGIASSMIQDQGVSGHTIIECNDSVVKRYHQWKAQYPGRDIRLVHGLWQDTIVELGKYDGIFFHTYPLNEEEYMKYVHGAVTFAEHFFPFAAAHLKQGGVFSYFSNEIDSLSRQHQRVLFSHFSSFSLEVVPLEMPPEVRDTWWADTMVVVKAVK